MKKMMLVTLALCLLLTGCGNAGKGAADTQPPEQQAAGTETKQEPAAPAEKQEPAEPAEKQEPVAPAEKQEPSVTVTPFPDTTMENLQDAILAVSLKEGDAYVDDTGKMQMHVTIYTHDKYDLAQISGLKVGDTIVTHGGDVKISSLERIAGGTVIINGGLEQGGLELATDESTFFYEIGFNDAKNWYEVGEATIRVSVDFTGVDSADPKQGDVILYPGSFLVGEVTDYHFTPDNTTIRVENGQIVEMNRVYTP